MVIFLFIALYSIYVSVYGKALQKINIQFNVYKDNNREEYYWHFDEKKAAAKKKVRMTVVKKSSQ